MIDWSVIIQARNKKTAFYSSVTQGIARIKRFWWSIWKVIERIQRWCLYPKQFCIFMNFHRVKNGPLTKTTFYGIKFLHVDPIFLRTLSFSICNILLPVSAGDFHRINRQVQSSAKHCPTKHWPVFGFFLFLYEIDWPVS